jgi:hypothetical protein
MPPTAPDDAPCTAPSPPRHADPHAAGDAAVPADGHARGRLFIRHPPVGALHRPPRLQRWEASAAARPAWPPPAAPCRPASARPDGAAAAGAAPPPLCARVAPRLLPPHPPPNPQTSPPRCWATRCRSTACAPCSPARRRPATATSRPPAGLPTPPTGARLPPPSWRPPAALRLRHAARPVAAPLSTEASPHHLCPRYLPPSPPPPGPRLSRSSRR